MLKLHHLNLMNEIQETALMLNLYEQKQLLRQQQEQMRQLQELRMLEERERHSGSGDRASGHHGQPPQRSPQPSLQEMDRTAPVTVSDKRQLNPEQEGNERGIEQQQQLVAMAENKRLKVQ
jgi:hypothetical protein